MNSGKALEQYAPVTIGGIGGGGTRLPAMILRELGYFMGSDVNEALDNHWFVLLFKRPDILTTPLHELGELLSLFINAMVGQRGFSQSSQDRIRALAEVPRLPWHEVEWLRQRAELLIATGTDGASHDPVRWGWKEPNTHIILDSLNELLPRMKYVHVVRNGLDSAHSDNQNQVRLWGPELFGLPGGRDDPYHSLKYWCCVQRRVLEIGAKMGTRFLFLSYDDLCADPKRGTGRLAEFLELQISETQLSRLSALVKAPSTIGRFKRHPMDVYDPDDVAYVSQLGFDTATGR